MIWARVKNETGKILFGVIEGDVFHPRQAMASPESAGEPVALGSLALLPPVVPRTFAGLWNNFHAAAEKNGWAVPEHPLYFVKPASALAGPGAEVAIPAGVGRVLFEGELGVVIGRRCRNISVAEAPQAILGYTCVNDLTALDVLNAYPGFAQWSRAKGFSGFGVIGPFVATDLDWRALTVNVHVNGRERQAYEASDMIFGPEEIVSRMSRDFTLMPGDVIACGTSLGVRPVKAGDTVVVSVNGIGELPISMTDGAAAS